MAKTPIPSWYFVLAVVRRDDRLLLVHERKHGGGWYLPAGRVEPGETFVDAAIRETLEESGIDIEVEGVLRLEHSPHPTHTRVRVIVAARPTDPHQAPRAEPNEHTLGAAFYERAMLDGLPLRGPDVVEIFDAVANGAPIAPISILCPEGAPWPRSDSGASR